MFAVKPLDYDYNTLEPFIDEKTMHLHHDGHYATYVKNLNDVLAGYPKFLEMDITGLIQSLGQVPEEIRQKVINNGGGVYNHELFWTIIAPQGEREPSGKLLESINNNFNDFKECRRCQNERYCH